MVWCLLVETLFILSFYVSHSETITCSKSDCTCDTENEECNLQCLSKLQCKNKTIKCNQGYPCDVDCGGNHSNSTGSCRNAIINSNNATNLTVHCSESNDCKSATINCNNANFCNIICKSTDQFSKSSICEGLILNCGTSQCSITCDNNTNTCANIEVNISFAHSFECIGSNMSCLYAPNPIINMLPMTLAPSTPSPILRIPHITPSKSNNKDVTSIIFVSEIIPIETIEMYSNNKSNNLFLFWLMDNPLFILLISAMVTFSICLCVILYCFIKQKYEFNPVNINKDKCEHSKNNKNDNIQIIKSANVTQMNDKKRYRHRIETQSHISYTFTPSNIGILMDNNYENSEINLFKQQQRKSLSFNVFSLITPSTNNGNNMSPHLPLPITPINEYKQQPVSPIHLKQQQNDINNKNNIILPPPKIINEGMNKENITMAINEKYIINEQQENDMYCSEEEEEEEMDDNYDNIMTDDGISGSVSESDNYNPNIKDDEFIIKGDDESIYNETKGIEMDLSMEIDIDMISIMSSSNRSEEGILSKRKNKKLNFDIQPIDENLSNNIKQNDIDAISL